MGIKYSNHIQAWYDNTEIIVPPNSYRKCEASDSMAEEDTSRALRDEQWARPHCYKC